MTSTIRLRFLGEERVFTRWGDVWRCTIVDKAHAYLNMVRNDRWELFMTGTDFVYGDTPQSAVAALEDALIPLAKVLAPLVEKEVKP